MLDTINIIKGVHPGIILDRELKKRNLPSSRFAMSIDEYPQTISAIINQRRGMNPKLSLKIESVLGIEEGYFMVLQAFYDIKEAKRDLSKNLKPDLSKIRPGIFWDARIENINWIESKKSIIKRVFERGNDSEILEIIRFYGENEVHKALQSYEGILYPIVEENMNKYLSN